MALRSKSLFLYGYTISLSRRNIDFIATSGGPTLTAILDIGDYSLTTLLSAIKVAMETADPAHIYTVSADRTLMGGTQNRITISTNGTFLSLLFSSGPNTDTAIWELMGFNLLDYTGSTAYTGSNTTGITLIPEFTGYNYQNPDQGSKVFGAVNVATSGLKESVVFNIQQFVDVEFKYEPAFRLVSEWLPLTTWMIQQKPFDFTPEISDPNTFYAVTLEKSSDDQKGMGFKMKEMLPNFPNFYTTGPMNFRIVLDYNQTVYIS